MSGLGAVRVVLCARESAAQQWLAGFERAFTSSGIAVELLFRDASDQDARPDAPQANVAIVWKPPAALFDEQRRLRLIFNLGAGVDALLALPNLPRDVTLIRLEDAGMAPALGEYVLTAVLRVYRGFDRYAQQQRDARWAPLPLADKRDVTVGVLGLGVIGGAIALRLRDQGFAVRGFARTPKTLPGIDCRHGMLQSLDGAFGAFLDGLQVLVSVLPLTDETVGVLNAGSLARLAPGAHLINVGRGGHLVDADVLHLLDRGQLGAATLDVFGMEPLPADHRYWRHPRVLVTPHVSAVTELEPAVAQIADKLAAWQRGAPLGGVVDFARGY
ncbi:MAG: 2-hydroxyacid dehydrogenase [Betaproteobacteria bacterium]